MFYGKVDGENLCFPLKIPTNPQNLLPRKRIQEYLTRELCTYIYHHTGCDVNALFRMRAWMLEEMPDPSGLKLPTVCLRSQKYTD